MNIDNLKDEVENWIKNYFYNKGTYNKRIYDAMFYSLNIGGKRIRPILMVLTYKLYNEDYKKIIPLASAVEMIHTYSLIHDDLPCMDDDDLRRGKPTNHNVFGEGVAVLAGDGLLNEAMEIMFDYCVEHNEAIKACDIITKASGTEGMIGGQIVDILSEGKDISYDELVYMHKNKTGKLIKAPIISGAILGGADENEIKMLEEYGDKLGIAFQIKDDILDVVGDTEILGKNIKSDEEKNKTNFVSVYGLTKSKEICENLTKECINILKGMNRNTIELQELTGFLLERNC